jgi:hypothetical protein
MAISVMVKTFYKNKSSFYDVNADLYLWVTCLSSLNINKNLTHDKALHNRNVAHASSVVPKELDQPVEITVKVSNRKRAGKRDCLASMCFLSTTNLFLSKFIICLFNDDF